MYRADEIERPTRLPSKDATASLHPFVAATLKHDYGEPDLPTVWQRELGLSLREANLAIIREERYKLVHFNGGLPPLLFDLKSPGCESVNLAGDEAHAKTLLRMTRRLLDHRMKFQGHRQSDMKLTGARVENAGN